MHFYEDDTFANYDDNKYNDPKLMVSQKES